MPLLAEAVVIAAIDDLILIGAGVFFTLYGLRVVGSKPGASPKTDEFHKKWGFYFKFAGPLLILGGIAKLLIRMNRD